MPLRKWYFAVNKTAIRDAFDLIHVAIVSARSNTSLAATCLIEDTTYEPKLQKRIDEMASAGVEIVRHNAEIFPEIEKIFGVDQSAPYNGHWLRTDIPILEKEDDVVLYTDFDVMFRSDVARLDIHPPMIACAPEHGIDDWSYFNSGVMVMNLPALRETRQELFAVVKEHIRGAHPHNDQHMLNICYRDRYERLPVSLNWKPYWGASPDADIVHFHGPKPGTIKHILGGHVYDSMPIYHEMFARNPEGYAAFGSEFEKYLTEPL